MTEKEVDAFILQLNDKPCKNSACYKGKHEPKCNCLPCWYKWSVIDSGV